MDQTSPEFLLPISMEEFFSTYWEKQPLHISRSSRGASAMIDLPRVESVLSANPVYYPGVQVTHRGHDIDVGSYVDEQNRVLPMRLFEHYSQGATIVLSQAQKLFPELNDLCRDVVRVMKTECQTNVYLSPPGNQGFNAHYDTHDVFILQHSGAKTFNFYPSSVELPFPGEQFDAARLTSSKVDESIKLHAGDTLYIPRGVVHDAVADEHLASIHVTLGVYPAFLKDYLDELLNSVLQSNERFRHSALAFTQLPISEAPNPLTEILQELLDEMKSALTDPAATGAIRSQLLDELSLASMPDCRGLSHGLSVTAFDEEGCACFRAVSVNQHMLIDWEQTHRGVKLRCHGQIIEFAEPIASFVILLLEQGRLGVDDMCSLDLHQRTAVISRLCQENMITLDQ